MSLISDSRLFDPITGAWTARGFLGERLIKIGESGPTGAWGLDEVTRDPRFASDEVLAELIGKASTVCQYRRAHRATVLALAMFGGDWRPVVSARESHHRARATLKDLCAEAARRAAAHRSAGRMLARAVKLAGAPAGRQ